MKNWSILLFSFVLVAITFQSCQNDMSSLLDPRDAIAKMWRVTDNTPVGQNGYDVTIAKDGTDITKITLDNFHGLSTSGKLSATLKAKIITIPKQIITDGSTNYEIDGEGVISNDSKTIVFNYTIDDGDGPIDYVANFGEVITVKKKAVVAL